MMPSRRLTPAGSLPPSCRYLWTASRPVKTIPLISTGSPTLRERIFSSVKGRLREIISIQPFLDCAGAVEGGALAAVSPTHVADADKEGGGQSIGRADLHAEQSGFAAKTHRSDSEFIRGVQHVLLELIEFGNGIAICEHAQEL